MESVWSDLIFKESGKPESATSSMSETVFQLLVLAKEHLVWCTLAAAKRTLE